MVRLKDIDPEAAYICGQYGLRRFARSSFLSNLGLIAHQKLNKPALAKGLYGCYLKNPDNPQSAQIVGARLKSSDFQQVTELAVDCLTGAYCRDGIVAPELEECDDGNEDDGDGCTNVCKRSACGDRRVQTGVEECDDGNRIDTDACTNACKRAACGDRVIQEGAEECDDGNPVDTDACTHQCKLTVCGDKIVQTERGEECDDGNVSDKDGCTSRCKRSAPTGVPDEDDIEPPSPQPRVPPRKDGRFIGLLVPGTLLVAGGATGLGLGLHFRGQVDGVALDSYEARMDAVDRFQVLSAVGVAGLSVGLGLAIAAIARVGRLSRQQRETEAAGSGRSSSQSPAPRRFTVTPNGLQLDF